MRPRDVRLPHLFAGRRPAFFLLASLALLAVGACAEPLEFADWTIPVPEGTRIVVYAADGTRLFTGTMPIVRWTAAAGDFVYAVRANEETDEQESVRYRLVEPWE